MEGAVRNLTRKAVLNCMNGAFSDRWNDVARRGGIAAGALRFEWGQPVDPDAVRRELATGQYDTITLIHNETSTGTMTDLAAVMAVVREFPEVMSIVDTVSSFSVLPIEKDALGIDVMLTGSQKGLALPPGLVPFSVSSRALERARTTPARGFYFDFIEFLTNHEKGMTPTTPSIAHIHALRSKLDDIRAEGLEARYARHARLNRTVRDWGYARGFRLLPQEPFASLALNCFVNTPKLDVAALVATLKARHGFVIDGGYGKLKGKTIRISNMGDETDATIGELIAALDDVLPAVAKNAG
jgi:aspartate aminotransferase-like enzyme